MMTEDNGGEFGHGAHADEPSRATSIEEKLSNIATWFDDVLKDTLIANPGQRVAARPRQKRTSRRLRGNILTTELLPPSIGNHGSKRRIGHGHTGGTRLRARYKMDPKR